MKTNFLNETICSMKVMTNEERLEKFHQFLLNDAQNFLILFDSKLKGERLYGYCYTKARLNGVTVIYSALTVVGESEKVLGNLFHELDYAGTFIKKTGKFYDEPYSLRNCVINEKPEWFGGPISSYREEFQKKCEEKIQNILLEKYKTAEDIPDTLIKEPINEDDIYRMGWKTCYFEDKKLEFTVNIVNTDNNFISLADGVDYIIDTEGSVNDFAEEYDKTKYIRYLKMYYLAKKALAEFKPAKKDIIKKDILQKVSTLKDSVKNVRLYILGRDDNRGYGMDESIEGIIIECKFPVERIYDFGDEHLPFALEASNWSVTNKKHPRMAPLKEIYFEDIIKIKANRTIIYSQK